MPSDVRPPRRFARVRAALVATALALAAVPDARAQSALDRTGEGPTNPWAAGDVWGQFHRNGYAQSSTPERGPEPGDALEVQELRLSNPRGGTPTQLHVSDAYPDGSRTLWGTTLTHLVKARVDGETFEIVDELELTRRALAWNIHWNMQLGAGNRAFVPSPKTRSILRVAEIDPSDSRSSLAVEDEFELPRQIEGAPIVLNLTHDGWVVFVTDAAWVGAVRQDFSAVRFLDLPTITGDVTTHNSFPVDEDGGIYLVSFGAMTKVRWTGDELELAWRAPYDFRGEGCGPPGRGRAEVIRAVTGRSCTGSGTTPTLMGRGAMDRLVLAVDGRAPNRLVAFWRDGIPEDWRGLPGRDRRVAGVLALPHSTWRGRGFTAENSPPVSGYDAVVAQYAGFFPKCRLRSAPRGVQLARWDPRADRLRLVWANPDVPMNNVVTISSGSNLVYGSGRDRDCTFRYRGLDRASGAVRLEVPLGDDGRFTDGGNSNVVLPDRSIVFGVARGLVRVRPR